MAFYSSDTSIPDAVNRFTDNDRTDREVPFVQLAFQETIGTAPRAVSDRQGLPVTLIGLDTISGYIDGIEAALTTITGHVDGLEASLTTIAGHVDGVETLLTSLGGYVDGLEGLLDGVEGSLTSITTNTNSGAVVGNGAAATAQRVTLANDSTGVIATVTTVTTVSAVTAITNALPAGTNLLGKISASPETSTIYDGTTALTPKFAVIAASSSGNNTLVAAVSSKKIRVLAYNFMGNGAVNAKFQSGAGGTDLTGLKYIAAAGGGLVAPFNPAGWFETASNTLLNLNLSGAVAVGGELVYVEV